MPKQKLNAGQIRKELRELQNDKPRRDQIAKSLRDKGLVEALEETFDMTDEQRRELDQLPKKSRDAVARLVGVILENGGEIEFQTAPPQSIKIEVKGEISTDSNGEETYKATVSASTSIC